MLTAVQVRQDAHGGFKVDGLHEVPCSSAAVVSSWARQEAFAGALHPRMGDDLHVCNAQTPCVVPEMQSICSRNAELASSIMPQ